MKRPTESHTRGPARDWAPSREEYEALKDACLDDRDRLCLYVPAEGGFRVGEFCAIRRPWLDDGDVVIPAQDPETGWTPKTPQGARRIPLKWMDRRASELLSSVVEDYGWIGIKRGGVWLRVRKLGERVGLPKLYPHALRSYCATTWAYRLGDPFALQELMGWSTIGIALRYVRRTGRRGKDAVKRWVVENARL